MPDRVPRQYLNIRRACADRLTLKVSKIEPLLQLPLKHVPPYPVATAALAHFRRHKQMCAHHKVNHQPAVPGAQCIGLPIQGPGTRLDMTCRSWSGMPWSTRARILPTGIALKDGQFQQSERTQREGSVQSNDVQTPSAHASPPVPQL